MNGGEVLRGGGCYQEWKGDKIEWRSRVIRMHYIKVLNYGKKFSQLMRTEYLRGDN